MIVVVKNGPNLNASLSSFRYNRLGQHTHQPFVVVDEWVEGFRQAKNQGYRSALFINNGTVFTDWEEWTKMMTNYPHQGMISHMIWHPGKSFRLHDQCFFLDLDLFDEEDFTAAKLTHLSPIRSEQDMHDDYTPLWVKPCKDYVNYIADGFGQGLISRQLNRGLPIVNWNNRARQFKWYMYSQQPELIERFNQEQAEYNTLAETQLWVLNNEPIHLIKGTSVVTPGSGLFWILNATQPQVTEIKIVDISRTQLEFNLDLWNTWDGENYGEFAWHFIKKHELVHFEIDQANLEPLERLKLKNSRHFIEYINNKFDQLAAQAGVADFKNQWQQAKLSTTVTFTEANLVSWVLANAVEDIDAIWCSNILDYKWTMVHTSQEQFDEFKNKINGIPERV
jgi:hypothetical protein